jgi:cytochrome c
MKDVRYIARNLLTVALLCGTLRAAADDPARGQALYESRCIGCHSLDSHRVGPAHRGVVGRRAGSAPGFSYSMALKGANFIWTAQNLDLWLTNPEALVPGQTMGFRVEDAQDRADLIAYLTGLKNLPRNHSEGDDQ